MILEMTSQQKEAMEKFKRLKVGALFMKMGTGKTRVALKNIGMDAEELLRLKQLSGLQELFKDKEFSKSWENK